MSIRAMRIRFYVEFTDLSNVKCKVCPCVNEFDIMKTMREGMFNTKHSSFRTE